MTLQKTFETFPVRIRVNGEEMQEGVEPRLLLVQFLRETLGLTGTHIGCDSSQCGACMVHVNGRVIKSCGIFTVETDNADVVTIEGMCNKDGSLGPIQQAFKENHGLQCGFCTPGMIMAASELLKYNDNPSENEIRQFLKGNICRCTGYHNIVKSIQAIAKP